MKFTLREIFADTKGQSKKPAATILAFLLVAVFLFVMAYVLIIPGNSPFNRFINRHRFEVYKKEQIAFSYAFAGEYKKARPELEELVRIDPDNQKAHHLLGCTYARIGEIEKAIGEFNKVVQLNPRFHEAYANLGAISERYATESLKHKKYNEALRYLNEAETYYSKALSIRGEKKYKEFLKRFKFLLSRWGDMVPETPDSGKQYQESLERIQKEKQKIP
ncbi:MAG: tetratricopeptide repeat protein [bacterium]